MNALRQALNDARVLNKNTLITVLLMLFTVLAVRAMLPVTVDPNLKMVVSKNREPIQNLNQTRNIETSKVVMLDKLNLAHHNRFYHPELGDIGYGDHFFADVEATFEIHKAGSYHFVVASDDGFSLRINGRELCRFLSDRPLTTQRCPVRLAEGEHSFELSYFQAGAHAGLRVQYGLGSNGKLYWFGPDSPLMTIIKQ